MDFLVLAFVFIFGTIIGSFLNVVIYRYNSGTSPLVGRSHCFACGEVLSWRALIPVLSFLKSHGRCALCKVRLSWQYPLVELFSGAMFVAVYLLEKPLAESVFLIVIFSTLIVIAVYDLRHQIIPDGLVFLFAFLGLTHFLYKEGLSSAFHFPYAWTLVAGPLLFFPFWALWFFSQGRWLGLGDGKLALGIGWFLGLQFGGGAVMLAFWIGAAYALLVMALQRIIKMIENIAHPKSNSIFSFFLNKKFFPARLSMKSEIPFGPFLIVAVFIVYFTHVNFFDGSVTIFNFL